MMRETEHRQSCPWKLRSGDHLQDDLSDLSHRLFSILGGPTMFYARFCFKITEDNRLGRPKHHQKSMGLLWCHRCLVGLLGFTHADLALLQHFCLVVSTPTSHPNWGLAWWNNLLKSMFGKGETIIWKGHRAQTMFFAGDENMKSNTVMLSHVELHSFAGEPTTINTCATKQQNKNKHVRKKHKRTLGFLREKNTPKKSLNYSWFNSAYPLVN